MSTANAALCLSCHETLRRRTLRRRGRFQKVPRVRQGPGDAQSPLEGLGSEIVGATQIVETFDVIFSDVVEDDADRREDPDLESLAEEGGTIHAQFDKLCFDVTWGKEGQVLVDDFATHS